MERCCLVCKQMIAAADLPYVVRVSAPAGAPRYLHIHCLLRALEAVPASDGVPVASTSAGDDSTAGLLPADW
jgi:hypothetical protein